jgi:uncharacterized protein (TIGR02271 family)
MQSTHTKTIVGVFDSYATAERVVQELIQSGFSRNDVRITSNETFTSDAARGNAGLSGTGPGHSAGGGIAGFFRNLFGAGEADDATYADAISRGGAVVSVEADEDRIEMARDIIERYDPMDIDSSRSQRQDLYSDRDRHNAYTDSDRSIPVVEEQLEVGKREVQRGGVRVYSHIVEQPVEEQVTLREERVHVDRRPVDRAATEADFRPPEQVIEVTETVEEPVIGKRARVREEIVIGKEQTTRTETIRDSVRRTDVDVEQLGGGVRSTEFDDDFRNDFSTRYGSVRGASYDTYAPAYQYGYTSASDSRFQGRSWDEVRDDVRTDYMRNNPNSKWEQVQDAVRYGWEKVTRQRR